MIEVNKISKKFKEIQALSQVTFSVAKGEIFGLLGENGAGKTTLLRILATMLKPTDGSALINGSNIISNPAKVRADIGILFGGESGLYDRLSARENIEYFAQLNDMDKSSLTTRINELVKVFDMQEYIDRRTGKFSKGMKQKVAIARSIVHNPAVMLFDEPTSGLDVTATMVVRDFISSCRSSGKTVIFSSHSMSEVEQLCDRIGVIHKGQVKVVGTISDLKSKYATDNLEQLFVKITSHGGAI